MRNRITWFVCAGIWFLAGFLDILDHSAPLNIGFKFLAAVLFLGLAIGQICFEKRLDGKGEKYMNLLCFAVFGFLVVYLIIVLILT